LQSLLWFLIVISAVLYIYNETTWNWRLYKTVVIRNWSLHKMNLWCLVVYTRETSYTLSFICITYFMCHWGKIVRPYKIVRHKDRTISVGRYLSCDTVTENIVDECFPSLFWSFPLAVNMPLVFFYVSDSDNRETLAVLE
jgi:hypothetical protein